MEGVWTCIAGGRVLKIATFEGSGFLGRYLEVICFKDLLFVLWKCLLPLRNLGKKNIQQPFLMKTLYLFLYTYLHLRIYYIIY